MTKESQTRVDRIVQRLTNQRWLAPIISLALIIIALGTFTDSLKKISDFLQRIHDPKVARLRADATELHSSLTDFYRTYKDHPSMRMSFNAFRKQDSAVAARFLKVYQTLGIPETEIRKVGRLYELKHYLLVNHGIPPEDPESLFPEISFVTISRGPQRTLNVEDLQPSSIKRGDNIFDDMSYKLYSRALVTSPKSNAAEYVEQMMSLWRKNYEKDRQFIDFMNSLEWDLGYEPPELFLAQDSAVSTAFNPIYRQINIAIPQAITVNGPFYAHERIESLLAELEKLQH